MEKLINWEKGRDEIVITFISLLELARLQKLDIYQNEPDGSIYVECKESLEDFNPELADGFEPEEASESVSTEDLVAAAELSDPPLDETTLQ